MRIGVCSDIHGEIEALRRVRMHMRDRGVDEIWALGDLIGGSGSAEVVRLARDEFDLVLLGNWDAWLLAGAAALPEGSEPLTGRELLYLAGLEPRGRRHGVDCWHGAPSNALMTFFEAGNAPSELFALPDGTLGLVGHTHQPIAYARDATEAFSVKPIRDEPVFLNPELWPVVVANPGAVAAEDPTTGSWWLELDLDEPSLYWHHVSAER